MQKHKYDKSISLFERAQRVIPNGIPGHFNPSNHKPAGTYPFFCDSVKGANFFDIDGNKYIDYMCAYGPMLLGYKDPKVEEAVAIQNKKSDTSTLASPIMVELAEFLVDMIPFADWAYFAKNGADATNMATLIARAATGKRKIIAIEDGYHGSSPWMQNITRTGISPRDHTEILRIPWNDLQALENTLNENENEVAAFISSPYHHPAFKDSVMPTESYWDNVHKLLRKNGVLSICDDVRTGFRLNAHGSHEAFGYTPDISCYCKAIANGHPISAVVGTDIVKGAAGSIFQTGSFWFAAAPMAAALATLKQIKDLDIPTQIIGTGEKLFDELTSIAGAHGVNLKVTGPRSMPYMRAEHPAGIEFHQALCGECTQRGAFFLSHHNLFVSAAHGDEELNQTATIFDEAIISTLKKAS